MYITKQDVEKILDVMNKFPEAQSFKLEETGHSGIGSTTNLIVHTKVNDINGEFTVEISGVADW